MQCKLINDWIAIARTAKLYYHQGTYFPCGVSFKNVCGTCIWNSWPVGSEAKEPFIRPQGKNTSTTRSRWGNQVRYELYELYETQMKQNGQWTWTSEKYSPLKNSPLENIHPWKYSPLKNINPWKKFTPEKYSHLKMIHPWKILTLKIFNPEKYSPLGG